MPKEQPARKNHRVFFYRRAVDSIESPGDPVLNDSPMVPGADSMFKIGPGGELIENEWTLVTAAQCSIERASKPIEIVDGFTTTDQTQYVLRANWNRRLLSLDTHCIALIVHPVNRLMELVGRPVDHNQSMRELLIYVVDNVTRLIDIDDLPRGY